MWKYVQCTVQGSSHKKHNLPCQDYTYSLIQDDAVSFALADGAGSAKYSHYGAEVVTREICTYLIQKFDDFSKQDDSNIVREDLIEFLLSRLDERATQVSCERTDLASTLLAIAIKGSRYFIIHIGDGVIGYLHNNNLKVASLPVNGDFVNTTVFTTSLDTIQSMKLMKGDLKDIKGFVLMSDGSEAGLFHKKERKISNAVKSIMDSLIIGKESIIETLLRESMEELVSKKTEDDCAILVVRKEERDKRGFLDLNADEQLLLLNLDTKARNWKKRFSRSLEILKMLESGMTYNQIILSQKLPSKKINKYLRNLMSLNLIVNQCEIYRTAIVLDGNESKN